MKRKNATRSALFTSIISLLMCVSMLVGTTFAWFTDEVKSGRNVIAAGNLDIELYNDVTINPDAKVGSGTTLFDNIMGDLWEPGAVTYENFTVANVGNLALKYTIDLSVLDETETKVNGTTYKLGDAIKVGLVDGGIDAGTRTGVVASVSSWTALSAFALNMNNVKLDVGDTDTFGIVLYWEPDVDYTDGNYDNIFNLNNDRQGDEPLKLDIGVNLYATQVEAEYDSFGNDYDKDMLATADVIATPETIKDILATVEPGKVIGLSAGYYEEIKLTQDNLSLVSNSAVVGFLNLNAHDGITIDGVTFDQTGAKQTYTYATGNNQKPTDYTANITGDIDSPKAAGNIVIKNCTFTNTSGVATAAVSSYAPIYFNESGAATERASNITVDNCVFACNATQYISLNYMAEGTVVIKNNTFGSATYGTSHNTINATSNAANWTITGNEFNNWSTQKTAIGSSKQGSNIVTWTITGNEFNNEDGAVVLALKTSYTAENSVVTVENNIALDGNATIVTTEMNAENEVVYAGHKILLNNGVKLVHNAEELAETLKANENISVVLANDIDLPISSLGTAGADGEYLLGGAATEAITIDLNGNKLTLTTTYQSAIGAENPAAEITIKNGEMTSSQTSGTWNTYDIEFCNGDYAIENVTFDKPIALYSSATLKNVTINETDDYYALWITAEGQAVEIDGLTVNSGRGIKIDEQYVGAPAKVTLKVSNATFNTAKKAAILVKSAAGADITLSNVNIENTVAPSYAVWVDEDAKDFYDQVTVNGGKKIYEGDVAYANIGDTQFDSLEAAVNAAQDNEVIDLNGATFNEAVLPAADKALTIKDGTIEYNGAGLENKGNTTLENVTMNAGSAASYSNISYADSVTTYNNVNVSSNGGGIGATGGAQVTFNSGSIEVNSTSTSGRYLFYAEGEGTVITINNGEFADFTTTSQNQKRAYIYAGAGTTVYVNGGTFGKASTRDGYTAGILGDGTVIITGGTFGFNPSNWVAEGYQAVKSGTTWTVSAK